MFVAMYEQKQANLLLLLYMEADLEDTRGNPLLLGMDMYTHLLFFVMVDLFISVQWACVCASTARKQTKLPTFLDAFLWLIY